MKSYLTAIVLLLSLLTGCTTGTTPPDTTPMSSLQSPSYTSTPMENAHKL